MAEMAAVDLHEKFEKHYGSMWPLDRDPFARRYTGSPDYAMPKVQEAWRAFPATRAWITAREDAMYFGSGWIKIASDGSVERIAPERIRVSMPRP